MAFIEGGPKSIHSLPELNDSDLQEHIQGWPLATKVAALRAADVPEKSQVRARKRLGEKIETMTRKYRRGKVDGWEIEYFKRKLSLLNLSAEERKRIAGCVGEIEIPQNA